MNNNNNYNKILASVNEKNEDLLYFSEMIFKNYLVHENWDEVKKDLHSLPFSFSKEERKKVFNLVVEKVKSDPTAPKPTTQNDMMSDKINNNIKNKNPRAATTTLGSKKRNQTMNISKNANTETEKATKKAKLTSKEVTTISENKLARIVLDNIQRDSGGIAPFKDGEQGSMYVWDLDQKIWVPRKLDSPWFFEKVCELEEYYIKKNGKTQFISLNGSKLNRILNFAYTLCGKNVINLSEARVPGLNLADGFNGLYPHGFEFTPPRPEHYQTDRLPYTFDEIKNAKPKKFFHLLSKYKDDDKLFLQEFFGTCLIGNPTKYEKALMLMGSGRNGKSTLLKVIQSVFPKGSVCNITPTDFQDNYKLIGLKDKKLNTVYEISKRRIIPSDIFKTVVSGEYITAREIRQPPTTFAPFAGHCYLGNFLPRMTDSSYGMQERWIFVEAPDLTGTKKIIGLADQIIEEETPAVINWLLAGAERVHRQNGYTIPASSKSYLREWRGQNDSVKYWLTDDNEIKCGKNPVKELYSKYSLYCSLYGLIKVSLPEFGRRLSDIGLRRKRDNKCVNYIVTEKDLL